MRTTQKFIFVSFVIFVAINFGGPQTLTKVPFAHAEQPQDRYMSISYCNCGNGYYGIRFDCYLPGDECYPSSGCFCN